MDDLLKGIERERERERDKIIRSSEWWEGKIIHSMKRLSKEKLIDKLLSLFIF